MNVLLAAVLAFSGSPAAAQSPTSEAYNAKATPLDDLSRELLLENGYVIREDGKIWDRIADSAVRLDEMSYLLSRLAGARRLKALLELNLILNRSEGEKKLTSAERETVRKLLRKHWAVFGVGTRKDFRAYFSVQELTEELNKIPPRFDRGSVMLMRDPDPATAPSVARVAAPISVTAPPPAAYAPIPPPAQETQTEAAEAPRQFFPRAVLTPLLEPLSLRRPSPFAPRARPIEAAPRIAAVAAPIAAPMTPPAIAAVLGAMAPVDNPPAMLSGPGTTPLAAAPAPPPAAAPPAAPLATPSATPSLFGSTPPPQPAVNAELGMLKPWTPPDAAPAPKTAESELPRDVAPAPAPAVQPAAPAAPAPPQPADATQAEFDAFVANGPYGREGQTLLKMISEKAPEFCRAILRRTVVRGAPLIVIDGARAGSDRRAGFTPSDPAHPIITIALSAGPLLIERRKGLFGKTTIALPEDPRAWAELGVAPPALEALKKDSAPAAQENGPWGAVRIYGDRSRRGTYSAQEQAGELLERLLLLGLEREGFSSSTYAARAWARVARLLFSARVADDYGNDSFLDRDRRLELRDWTLHSDESDDLLVASWSSSRGNVLDPRRGGPESQALYERQAREACTRSLLADHLAEAARNLAARVRTVEALAESGLIAVDAAKAAAEKASKEETAARAALLASPPACDGRFGADENGLRRSSALLAEASRAERAFRERISRGQNHE